MLKIMLVAKHLYVAIFIFLVLMSITSVGLKCKTENIYLCFCAHRNRSVKFHNPEKILSQSVTL